MSSEVVIYAIKSAVIKSNINGSSLFLRALTHTRIHTLYFSIVTPNIKQGCLLVSLNAFVEFYDWISIRSYTWFSFLIHFRTYFKCKKRFFFHEIFKSIDDNINVTMCRFGIFHCFVWLLVQNSRTIRKFVVFKKRFYSIWLFSHETKAFGSLFQRNPCLNEIISECIYESAWPIQLS